MKLSRRALLAAPALFPVRSWAQQYPDKQIRMIIPFAAGGTTDLLARAIGQQLSEAWGQPVVSDNRAGANGVIASEIVAKSAGDGYTLELVAMGHATNPLVYRKLPFDSDKDFTPISQIATFPQLVMVNPKVPARTLAELLALAKTANPPLTYGSGGNGSSQHFAGALFAHMAGIAITHVAYKGGNPALQDLMAGNVDMMIIQPNSPSPRPSDRRRGGSARIPVRRLVRARRPQGHAERDPEEAQRGGDESRPCQCREGRRRQPGRGRRRQHTAGVRGLHPGRARPLRTDRA